MSRPPSRPPYCYRTEARRPDHHLPFRAAHASRSHSQDTGRLAWQLSLDNNGDLPGANITTLLLPRELPTLALLSVAAVGDPSGGSGATPGAASGAVLAVDLANGSVRWATGALPGGAPSVALVTEGAVVLRGKADADLTQTLYGLRAATGALVWTKVRRGRGGHQEGRT